MHESRCNRLQDINYSELREKERYLFFDMQTRCKRYTMSGQQWDRGALFKLVGRSTVRVDDVIHSFLMTAILISIKQSYYARETDSAEIQFLMQLIRRSDHRLLVIH